ncbi:unnamed protein product [Cylicostephanus goldi]|uniref:Uncharacterized protein n=1 Tax=Cylicostephanus goldi TaxID=71465 RepID=A0A3P6QSJ3_CYLGO|nr:unnamed protein product [Cylicostephanus goldi]
MTMTIMKTPHPKFSPDLEQVQERTQEQVQEKLVRVHEGGPAEDAVRDHRADPALDRGDVAVLAVQDPEGDPDVRDLAVQDPEDPLGHALEEGVDLEDEEEEAVDRGDRGVQDLEDERDDPEGDVQEKMIKWMTRRQNEEEEERERDPIDHKY